MTDFNRIKEAYRENPVAILKHIIGKGRIEGGDYVALNPRRNDNSLGSFRIDIQTGRFHDFATRDRGGDIIDLTAFVYCCNCVERVGKSLILKRVYGEYLRNI